MSHSNYCAVDPSKSTSLLYKLCCSITGCSGDAVNASYQFALRALSTTATAANVSEIHITEKIKKKLVRDMREKDAVSFAELLRKLKSNTVLKNKTAILMFLLELSDSQQDHFQKVPFKHGLNMYTTSTPLYLNSIDNLTSNLKLICPTVASSLTTIPNGSPSSSNKYVDPSTTSYYGYSENASDIEHKQRMVNGSSSKSSSGQTHVGSKVARMISVYGGKDRRASGDKAKSSHSDTRTVEGSSSASGEIKYSRPGGIKISNEELLRAIIYAFQGIPGKFLIWEPSKNRFQISSDYELPEPKKVLILRLVELGSLYLKVHNYCKTRDTDKAIGLVEQSFVGALQQELMDYYRLLAVLEAQVQTGNEAQQGNNNSSDGLTLHRLVIWTFEPMIRMTVLASLVESCDGLKGGALASAVYSFLHHGDPSVRGLLKHILSLVVKPLCTMLSKWLFSGELEDTFLEFFITTNPVSSSGSLWHERYCLSKSMVPTFLTMNQARKVLSTGKAINFLRQMCNDHSPIHSTDDARRVFESNSVESLFSQDDDGEFQTLLETTYQEISRRVLTTLHEKYKFMDHLQAMRRYFLLGQGDFIRHLMDIAHSELNKPAEEILGHKLHSILEIAVRSTNAQYDDPDILRRLDYYLYQSQIGDTGWDVFSLDYRVDGPIGTVFTPLCKDTYMRLFHSLFRIKRMEYILTSMWKDHMLYSRLLMALPVVNHVLHRFHILTSVMIHFVQQVQYYIAFEVMECLWAELQQKVRAAKDLDQLIAAHEQFLDNILVRALVADQTEVATEKIRDMYNTVLQFKEAGKTFYVEATKVLESYRRLEQQDTPASEEQDSWEDRMQEERILKEKQKRFLTVSVPKMEKELQTIHNFFEATVNTFLMAVADYEDPNLQFLSFRVDFNNHYKKRNTLLHGSFTYQHMSRLGRRSSSHSRRK